MPIQKRDHRFYRIGIGDLPSTFNRRAPEIRIQIYKDSGSLLYLLINAAGRPIPIPTNWAKGDERIKVLASSRINQIVNETAS